MSPEKIQSVYETRPGQFVVAENEMWLPGIYDSEEAALYTINIDSEKLLLLCRDRGIGDDYRPITLDELKALA